MTHRTVKLALVPLAGLVSALLSVAPASADTSTWDLRAEGQHICVAPWYGGTYLLAPVVGSWSATVTTGITDLPPGISENGGATIPPGSNYPNPDNGAITVNGWALIKIDEGVQVGEYTAHITATDGTRTLEDPVGIDVRDRC